MANEKIPATVRNSVWNIHIGKDNKTGMCFCCGTEVISYANFDCGHITSKNNGGLVTLINLRPICGLCNKSIGTKNMEDFMSKYGFHKNDTGNIKAIVINNSKKVRITNDTTYAELIGDNTKSTCDFQSNKTHFPDIHNKNSIKIYNDTKHILNNVSLITFSSIAKKWLVDEKEYNAGYGPDFSLAVSDYFGTANDICSDDMSLEIYTCSAVADMIIDIIKMHDKGIFAKLKKIFQNNTEYNDVMKYING